MTGPEIPCHFDKIYMYMYVYLKGDEDEVTATITWFHASME